jgi:CheY-like chemotaxis protein
MTVQKAGHETLRLLDDVELDRALAKREPLPELLLLDLMLRARDGYEVLRAWKADRRTRDIPVIIISARGAEQDKVKGLELGAEFSHLGLVGLGNGAGSGGRSAFAVELVDKVLDFCSLGFDGAVALRKLLGIIVAIVLHGVVILHDGIQSHLHFVDRGAVLFVLIARNEASGS